MTSVQHLRLKHLAEREAQAHQDRAKAELAYRRRAWETNFALAEFIGDKVGLGEAQQLVSKVTGNSLSYVQARTRVGRAYDSTDPVVYSLPPRMAMEALKHGPVDADVVADLIRAEAEGTTLREYAAMRGGKPWADTPAGASESTITSILEQQPELVAKVVSARSETLVAELSPQARLDLSQALDRQIAVDHPTPGPADPTGAVATDWNNPHTAQSRVVNPIIEAGRLMHMAEEAWREHWPNTSPGDKKMVARALQENLIITERLRMDVVLDDETETAEQETPR